MADIDSVKSSIQINLLKQEMEIQKKGVIDLYRILDSLQPTKVDAYIPTDTGAGKKGTYKL